MTETVRVGLADRAYDVVVGPGLLDEAGRRIRPFARSGRAVLVSDETVASLWLDPVKASLEAAGLVVDVLTVPPGESSKTFPVFEDLTERLLGIPVDRGVVVVALGGGVIGDLAGFVAAVALRGLDYVQIPTTLLSQVDSSVGGKTAIDSRYGKNLIGAFHQPRLVLADTDTLRSLPGRELRAGYAEVVKYGALGDRRFFDWLEQSGARLLDGDEGATIEAVARSVAAKAAIVAEDEREAGRRALLNLGHTFGHAIEAEAGFGQSVLHGEGVSVGMALAFEMSFRLGYCPAADRDRLVGHLRAVGLPTEVSSLKGARDWTPRSLVEHMRRDKKVSGGRLTFVLARGIGDAFVERGVDEAVVEALLEDALAA